MLSFMGLFQYIEDNSRYVDLCNALFFFQILNFADGEKYKFVDVTIIDDNIPEGDEMFQLILANPSRGLELGNNTTGKTKEK